MRLLSRIRSRLESGSQTDHARSSLAAAERLLRRGAAAADIRRTVDGITAHNDLDLAWLALFRGDTEAAIEAAWRAADDRPYDVDSRIIHGLTRLARNDLDHAAHEFDAVIEEFGAERDAADGRRAVILARGFAPLDELPASDADWRDAATLLTTLWRLAGAAEARWRALSGEQETGRAHDACLAILRPAVQHGLALDQEADDGAV